MENRRFILIALLGVTVFFLYQAWQEQYGPKASAPTVASAPALAVPDESGDAPSVPSSAEPAVAVPGSAAVIDPIAGVSAGVVHVDTDVLRAEISLRGGELRRLELLRYPVSKETPEAPLPLLNDRDGQFFILQSGLASTQGALSSSQTVFAADRADYRLEANAGQLSVVLRHQRPDGVVVQKTFRFTRGSYRVDLVQQVQNGSDQPLVVSPYARFVRNERLAGDLPRFANTFLGVGFYEHKDGSDGFRYVKTKSSDVLKESFEKRQVGGWIAMLQHYFVAAILPPEQNDGVYSAGPARDGRFNAQYVATGVNVAPGATEPFVTGLFLGPRLQDSVVLQGEDGTMIEHGDLDVVAPGLEYTVDYGILTPICKPLFWLLSKFHSLAGNWGVAIILLTLAVKGAFFKLSEAQYRSMAKMKKFAPRIQALKERYGDDRERMSKAMMELYKKEGFNPLAGCWPMLVQFPVFIALYWVLLESVELRQADFGLWIHDLTAPDPFYVLPVLFGITFWLQQRWSGSTATMDPTQQKIMQVMPIMMTAFFTFFQSGLVLYWLISNLVGMTQQWFINRKLHGEEVGHSKTA